MTTIAFIGFGEAGGLITRGLREAGADVRSAYDILIDDPARSGALQAKAQAHGIVAVPHPKDAVANADIVISAVVSSQAVAAAEAASPHMAPGQIYVDMNSASPATKRTAAAAIEAGGAHFVESAVMDLVPPHGHKVPMLLTGPRARDAQDLLRPFGMDVTAIGERIGDASAVKMVRSVFMKGFTAILVESLYAAKKLNAHHEVLKSLQVSFPELNWQALVDYYAPRLVQHARRQGIEMHSVAETLEELGIEPITAEASGERLLWLADRRLDERLDALPTTFDAFLDALAAADDEKA